MIDKRKSDEDLAMAWKTGNQAAAEELLRRYRPLILSLTRKTNLKRDFEDIQQDLILDFLKQAKIFEPKGTMNFSGFISRRLTLTAFYERRKAQYYSSHEELTLEEQPETVGGEIAVSDTLDVLPQVAHAARLTQKQSRVFYLWMQGLSPQEIQAETGICPSSLSRMKEMIRQRLRAHREEIAEWVTA